MDDAQHGNDPDQQKGRFALFLILTSMFVLHLFQVHVFALSDKRIHSSC